MWQVLRSVFIFVAAIAGFTLAVLEILKNHLGMDTSAILLGFGSGVGTFLASFSAAFGELIGQIAQIGGEAYIAAIALVLNMTVLALSLLAFLFTRQRMLLARREAQEMHEREKS